METIQHWNECYLCEKIIDKDNIDYLEMNESFVSYGYCICKNCANEFENGIEEANKEINDMLNKGFTIDEIIKLSEIKEA